MNNVIVKHNVLNSTNNATLSLSYVHNCHTLSKTYLRYVACLIVRLTILGTMFYILSAKLNDELLIIVCLKGILSF